MGVITSRFTPSEVTNPELDPINDKYKDYRDELLNTFDKEMRKPEDKRNIQTIIDSILGALALTSHDSEKLKHTYILKSGHMLHINAKETNETHKSVASIAITCFSTASALVGVGLCFTSGYAGVGNAITQAAPAISGITSVPESFKQADLALHEHKRSDLTGQRDAERQGKHSDSESVTAKIRAQEQLAKERREVVNVIFS